MARTDTDESTGARERRTNLLGGKQRGCRARNFAGHEPHLAAPQFKCSGYTAIRMNLGAT